MPHLIAIAAAGAAAWAGYRWFRKEMRRVEGDLRAADEALRQRAEKAIPTLRRDPETGVYSPDRG